MVGIFIYNYSNDNVPDIFDGFFQRKSELHNRNTRQSNDLHVRFAGLEIRKFSLRIHGATIWNDTPLYIKHAISLNVFKQMLRKHLSDKNVHGFVTHFQLMSLIIGWIYYHFQRNIICRKLVFVVQLLLSHCRFGTLAAFMVTTPATRVSFGGDYSSLLVTRWESLGWCDAHDCIVHLLTCFAPWHKVIILMLYAIYRWSQINPSWVSDSQCDCMYVLAYYK